MIFGLALVLMMRFRPEGLCRRAGSRPSCATEDERAAGRSGDRSRPEAARERARGRRPHASSASAASPRSTRSTSRSIREDLVGDRAQRRGQDHRLQRHHRHLRAHRGRHPVPGPRDRQDATRRGSSRSLWVLPARSSAVLTINLGRSEAASPTSSTIIGDRADRARSDDGDSHRRRPAAVVPATHWSGSGHLPERPAQR